MELSGLIASVHRDVTISNDQREDFQSRVTDFNAQPEPDNCLPTAVKNICDDLARRKEVSGLEHSLSEFNDALEYQAGRASVSDRVAARIDPLIEQSGHEVMIASPSPDQLQNIAESESTSLPVCEVDAEYFEYVEHGYEPEQGIDRYGRFHHVIIPVAFNDSTILYYDPYINFFADLGDGLEMELPYETFYELWNRPEKRWTLWIREQVQKTLTASTREYDDSN